MKKISLMLIMVFVLLPCTACNEELPPVEDVVDNMVEAMGEVESFRNDTEVNIQLYFMAEDMPGFFPLDLDLELNAVGAHDLANREMEAVMNLVFTGADGDSLKTDISFYIIGEEMYVMMDYPVISPMWIKSEIPGMYMNETGDFKVFMKLFQLMGMEITGRERKEGINCYVLEATPDIKRIFASFLLPAGYYDTGYSESEWEIIEEIFQEFSMKLWVAHDTYRIIYADISIQMEVSPEAMGDFDEEGLFRLDMAVKTHYHHYNQSMDIDLPPEAEDAEEASIW